MQFCYVCLSLFPEEARDYVLDQEHRAVAFAVEPGKTIDFILCWGCDRPVCSNCAPHQASGYCEECIEKHGLQGWITRLEADGTLQEFQSLGGVVGMTLEEVKAGIVQPFRFSMLTEPPVDEEELLEFDSAPSFTAGTLKEAKYRDFSGGEYSTVVYSILNECCVFCGITPPPARTSTINAAEDIILEICRQEHLHPAMFTFFDLQTFRGYQKHPGEFEFDKIVFELKGIRPVNLSWHSVECPKWVMELFREYIG